MMTGRDFIGVPLMLTDAAFRVHEHSGKRTPILYPPGIDPAELEPGLVFSMDDDDFRTAVKPERWLADGLVVLASVDPPAEPVPVEPDAAPTATRARRGRYSPVEYTEATDGP